MSGYILHLLLLALAVVFWRARAGRGFDQLLDASHHAHERVLAVFDKHPKGGAWADHQRWMAGKP